MLGVISKKDDVTLINILDKDDKSKVHSHIEDDIKYHCYKNNFALCFPVWLTKKDYAVDESIIDMGMDEIESLAKGLIQKAIDRYSQYGDETIGGKPTAIRI